jgi:hypothetical protein
MAAAAGAVQRPCGAAALAGGAEQGRAGQGRGCRAAGMARSSWSFATALPRQWYSTQAAAAAVGSAGQRLLGAAALAGRLMVGGSAAVVRLSAAVVQWLALPVRVCRLLGVPACWVCY